MRRINLLFTLSSLTVILVTLERYSFTTEILLQPYSFLRLHEVVQMSFIILLTVIIPAFILKHVTDNFKMLQTKKGQFWALIFLVGVYFYGTGNGLHEVASFFFHHFCKSNANLSVECGSMFFNNYYAGNIMYFIGGYLMNLSLIVLELANPISKQFKKKDMMILVINSLLYGFAIFAYAAFDTAPIGIIYAIATMISADVLLYFSKKKYFSVPVTFYFALTYTLATIASVIVRFR